MFQGSPLNNKLKKAANEQDELLRVPADHHVMTGAYDCASNNRADYILPPPFPEKEYNSSLAVGFGASINNLPPVMSGSTSITAGGNGTKLAFARTRLLPTEFTPSPYTVIFGRGKQCTDACGNRRLRIIVGMHVERYSKAVCKEEKSDILSEVYDMIQDACPDITAFVRMRNERWHEVDPSRAREKISGLFRDHLDDKYRSSNKSKVRQRRERKQCSKGCSPLRSDSLHSISSEGSGFSSVADDNDFAMDLIESLDESW
jgi:hypothetical protein